MIQAKTITTSWVSARRQQTNRSRKLITVWLRSITLIATRVSKTSSRRSMRLTPYLATRNYGSNTTNREHLENLRKNSHLVLVEVEQQEPNSKHKTKNLLMLFDQAITIGDRNLTI